MVGVDERVAETVVFIRELDGGGVKHNALLHAVPLGEGAGGDVADDDLEGDDGDLLDEGLPVGKLPHEVGGHALLLQQRHQVVGHPVVDDAFSGDSAPFFAVKGGGVVLVFDDQQFGVVGAKDHLGLAFVQLLQLLHSNTSMIN